MNLIVLNSFSFFGKKFPAPEFDVSFWFPVPLMFANFLFGPLMPIFAAKLSTKSIFVGGITILCFFLILLVLVAVVGDGSKTGFALSLVITFCVGKIIIKHLKEL